MDNTYHSLNNASHLNQSSIADAAPIDPKQTASRGKPPGQTEAGIPKSGTGGTLAGKHQEKILMPRNTTNPTAASMPSIDRKIQGKEKASYQPDHVDCAEI